MEGRQKILQSALQLFAQQGYASATTLQIAKRANVSEALIFKYFGTKEDLLKTIYADAEQKSEAIYHHILEMKDPQEVVLASVRAPFGTAEREFPFWKLIFKLKWEEGYNNPDHLLPWLERLQQAFTALDYSSPRKEAQLLLQIINAVAIDLLQGNLSEAEAYRDFLIQKYSR